MTPSRNALVFATLIATAAPAIADDGAFDLQVGGAAVVSPKYEGSKDYEVRGFPIVAPAGGSETGNVQFRGIDNVRFRLFRMQGFEAGPLAGYRFGRDEDDADRLRGLGDVDGGLIVGGYAAYDFGALKPFLSYHHQVTGDDAGGFLRFGAESRLQITDTIAVTAVAGATYAGRDYMTEYFSVSAAQSAASGLAAYDADAAIKDVYFGLSTSVPLTDVWSLKLSGQYTHLLSDASDSPIVETDSQFSGLVGLSYRFSLQR